MTEFVDNGSMKEFDHPVMKTDDNLRSMGRQIQTIEDAYNEQNDFQPGQFYSFVYDYLESPIFRKLPETEKRFYDRMPIIYFYGYKNDKNYIEGLNFHFMPVESRLKWLETVDKLTESAISDNRKIILPPDLIKKINTKNPAAVRVYKVDRMSQVHRLDSSKLVPVMTGQARTFDGAGYGTVALRYRTWLPKEK